MEKESFLLSWNSTLKRAMIVRTERDNEDMKKMRALSRVGMGVIVANCLGIYGWSTPERANEPELAAAAESLGSSDYPATEATRVLFAAGLRAIVHPPEIRPSNRR